LNALALVLSEMSEKLGCLEVWWLGGIYSPNHQNGRWGSLLSKGAPDSLVRQPRHPTVRVRSLELYQPGPLDSPVVHRTVTVHCPVHLLAPALTLHALFAHCSAFTGFRWSRSLRCSRCSTGTPDSPVNYSGVAFSETRRWRVRVDPPWCTGHCPVVRRTLSGGTPDSPMRQTRATFGFFCSFHFEPYLGLFIGLG
jgi:hypothetical protein